MLNEESPSVSPTNFHLALSPAGGEPPSFAAAVRSAVKRYKPGEEFTVRNIEQILLGDGVKLPEKNARARIAMVLQEMVERESVKKSFEGTGSMPHRYKSNLNGGANAWADNNSSGVILA
jgi:hypothetical protein